MKTPRTLLTIIAATGLTLSGCGKGDQPHNNAVGHNNNATINYYLNGPITLNTPAGSSVSGNGSSTAATVIGKCSDFYTIETAGIARIYENKNAYEIIDGVLEELDNRVQGKITPEEKLRNIERFFRGVDTGEFGAVPPKCDMGDFVITEPLAYQIRRGFYDWFNAHSGGVSSLAQTRSGQQENRASHPSATNEEPAPEAPPAQNFSQQEQSRHQYGSNRRRISWNEIFGGGEYTPGGTVAQYHQRASARYWANSKRGSR